MSDAVRSTRKDYAKGALKKEDLPVNPLRLLSQWVEEAAQADPEDYNAMCIATQGLSGGMNGRIVLLRALEGDGLRFFTNYESEKGKELSASPEHRLRFLLEGIGTSGARSWTCHTFI